MSLKDQAAQFSSDKKQLNPFWKPETNIPSNIILVRSAKASQEENQQGDKYAVLSLLVDLEMEDELVTKTWNVTSERCVDTLIEKGVDVGSSFTVLAKGEGINKKYEISNVKNRESVTTPPLTGTGTPIATPPAPTAQGTTTQPAPTSAPAVTPAQ